MNPYISDVTRRYLDRLADESDDRAQLVSALAAAASYLDGTNPFLNDPSVDFHATQAVQLRLAPKLRDAAQRLCDHARISSDDTCRYCGTLMVQPG